ncbi:DNA polymerase III subunit beta [Lactobacillus sp. S2-2]|uniref:DNA polymerase III subunit beta n=1 Tax=Lactobacillus sp. S2-2 TaxID=2692917 RepID=UPI001F0285C8|nr:DNA polymerase III subunit beta [Lactobacillus sp. S2-2]MCF6515394.1 DNA polymerase III subunit beta [Lactobacillus sp. S2-2]
MKFSIKRSVFINSLNIVQRAISSKTTIPILTGLKLEVFENKIILTGSDADVSIQTTIDADNQDNELSIEQSGNIVLPARFFNEIVKKLPQEIMNLEVNDNFKTKITSGPSEFTINGLDANNYPHLPEVETENSIHLSADIFKEIINQTVISVSKQESRPILTGIHVSLNENQILAVATDSHRLSQRKVELQESHGANYDIVIPGKSLSELAKMIDDNQQSIQMDISENQVLFTFGKTNFYSRLLEGNYPDTSRLIPKSSETKIEFNSSELLGAIERASLLSHESRNNVIKLTINPSNQVVTITGDSPDVGNVEEDLQPSNSEGADLEISFNPDYMKEALRAFGNTEINLSFTSALRPFTLIPTGTEDGFIQLITPVRTF